MTVTVSAGLDWSHSEVVFSQFPIRHFQHHMPLSVKFPDLLVSSTYYLYWIFVLNSL